DLYWLHEVRNYLIDGICSVLREGDTVANDTRLSWWCLAIGFCRWFQNGDVHRLSDLRTTLVETSRPEDINELSRIMQCISPSEVARNPRPQSGNESRSPKPAEEVPPQSYGDLIRGIQSGGYCLLPQAVELVRDTLSRH